MYVFRAFIVATPLHPVFVLIQPFFRYQITQWKKEFLESAEDIFSKKKTEELASNEAEKELLYSKIGRLQKEVDFFKRVLGK